MRQSLGFLAKKRKLSPRQQFQLLTEFTQSVHWNQQTATLRTNLLNNPGHGSALSFSKLLKSLGPLFHYIRQWPYFVSSNYGVQVFFMDFFFPKLRVCVEIDGRSHNDPSQKQWDCWRTNFLKDNYLEVLRYNSDSFSLSSFLSDAAIAAPIKYQKEIVSLCNKRR